MEWLSGLGTFLLIIALFVGTTRWILASSASLNKTLKKEIVSLDGVSAIMLSISIASPDGSKIDKFAHSAIRTGTLVTTVLEIVNQK